MYAAPSGPCDWCEPVWWAVVVLGETTGNPFHARYDHEWACVCLCSCAVYPCCAKIEESETESQPDSSDTRPGLASSFDLLSVCGGRYTQFIPQILLLGAPLVNFAQGCVDDSNHFMRSMTN